MLYVHTSLSPLTLKIVSTSMQLPPTCTCEGYMTYHHVRMESIQYYHSWCTYYSLQFVQGFQAN